MIPRLWSIYYRQIIAVLLGLPLLLWSILA